MIALFVKHRRSIARVIGLAALYRLVDAATEPSAMPLWLACTLMFTVLIGLDRES